MVMADIHGGSDEKAKAATTMSFSQTCSDHPSTASTTYRSEFEPTYRTFGRRSSLSPSSFPSPTSSSSPTYTGWSRLSGKSAPSTTPSSSNVRSHRHREDVLHAVLGNARVTKSTAPSLSLRTQYSNNHSHNHHYHYDRHDEQSPRTLDHAHSRSGSKLPSLSSSSLRSSSYSAPRSDNRLPSLFDRIKAALENPRRVSSPLSSPQQHQQQQHYQAAAFAMDHVHHPSSMAHPSYANTFRTVDERLVSSHNPQLQPPTLFGVKCTEISQRAYSGQSSEMKQSFDRLQHMDNGKVEYRTIAFCAHLTVSRWEPVIPVTPAAGSPSGEGNATKDPVQAARLMSLANYVRHILSLTNGSPSAQPPVVAQPQQTKLESQKQPKPSSDQGPSRETTSSGPGPIKSESSRRHRYSPDYHGHPRRRHTQLHGEGQQQARQLDAYPHQDNVYRERYEEIDPQTHAHQEQQRSHQFNPALTSSQFPSQDLPKYPQTSQPQSSLSLLKIPYPNLTLTLALIYVDRLKAKYPEAKGEPGCSHRLFLVAFIIAAKYRCSVELSPPMPQELNDGTQETNGKDSFNGSSLSLTESPGPIATLEARLNAELIFSNHAWVRLLNLGSFYRQPTTPTAASAPGQMHPTQPSDGTYPPTTSPSPVSQQPSQTNQLPSLASILNSAPASSVASLPAASGILQVEDLDRMEAEFLRFLNFDLAAMSHDLETCWNLLVGKKETPS